MIEIFQIWFIANPLFTLIGMLLILVSVISITGYGSHKLFKKLKKFIIFGTIVSIGIVATWGTKIIFNNVMVPAIFHMNVCETSTVSIQLEELNIDYDRDITLCRERFAWDSEEFTDWVLQNESPSVASQRDRDGERCGKHNVLITVNSDLINVSNNMIPVRVCIHYNDIKFEKIYNTISETP